MAVVLHCSIWLSDGLSSVLHQLVDAARMMSRLWHGVLLSAVNIRASRIKDLQQLCSLAIAAAEPAGLGSVTSKAMVQRFLCMQSPMPSA